MQSVAFLSGIVILILVAPIFARTLKVSVSVVEIILGALVVWVGFVDAGNEVLKDIAKIGFFYLMFLAGVEVNIRKFISFKDKYLKNIAIYFGSLYSISFLLYFIFDLNPVYIVVIPIVSLGMIMVLINEHGKEHKWLELSLIIGVIGELISISALVIFDAIAVHGFGEEFYKNISILIVVLFVTVYAFKALDMLFWWFPMLRKTIMPDNDSMSQDIRVSMALFFILIAIMQYLHIDMVLGAFIAGVFIANFFDHKVELPHTLHRVGFGFLVPLFFIYVGTTLDINVLFTMEILYTASLIVIAMVIARLFSSFVAYYKYLGAKGTVLFSLGDSMPLTFLIAIATIAISNNAISLNEYYAFVLAAIIEAIVIMVIIKVILKKVK
ncbi:MAG: cation:proton antiporter [Sulfurimonas sp.]|uniref:cation:proton antiporter n=1 Tax=Sulfurimonas sp. TaxID=2022749 RepID=UPI0026310AC7|nr:cation:proton antiporter [Sulfurimonas sp.]MDD3475416.1 cation:proton antiporter [Sulfurimonas sp.]HUH41868.1 cation:proton antiporter [Sulfurimonas sp.]